MVTCSIHLNLLAEPVFSVAIRDDRDATLSLPGVLECLGAGETVEYRAVRPHQTHAWHAFLAQIGAIVASRVGDDRTERSATEWADRLSELTEGPAAWALVVDDLAQPGFMQPPVPEGCLGTFKPGATRPDELDILATARNHDVKNGTIAQPRSEHWVYALIALQTMEGFSGKNNYGIARMNSGFGSRPALSTVAEMDWSYRFRRDVRLLLVQRRMLLDEARLFADENGVAFLWTVPWDGQSSMPLAGCDPLVIEVCRRARLVLDGDRIVARLASSACPRLAARDLKGDTGDLWTPMRIDNAALTVSGRGFDYDLMRQLLFADNYRRSPAQQIDAERSGDHLVVAEGLARGQGTTDGFHQRVLPVPGRVAPMLMTAEGTNHLAELARERVDVVQEVRRKVLHPALCVLIQGAPAKLDLRDDRTRAWTDRLTAEVDRVFFDRLWADADRDIAEATVDWQREVLRMAAAIVEAAIASTPMSSANRYRVIVTSESVFWGSAHKRFADAVARDSVLPDKVDSESQEEELDDDSHA